MTTAAALGSSEDVALLLRTLSDGRQGLVVVDMRSGELLRTFELAFGADEGIRVTSTEQGPVVVVSGAPPLLLGDASLVCLDALSLYLAPPEPSSSSTTSPPPPHPSNNKNNNKNMLILESPVLAKRMAAFVKDLIAQDDEEFSEVLRALNDAAAQGPPCAISASVKNLQVALLTIVEHASLTVLHSPTELTALAPLQAAATCCLEQLREQLSPRTPNDDDFDDVHVELVRRLRSPELPHTVIREGFYQRGSKLAHISGLLIPNDADSSISSDPHWELHRLLQNAPPSVFAAMKINVPISHSVAARILTGSREPAPPVVTLVAASNQIVVTVSDGLANVFVPNVTFSPFMRLAFKIPVPGSVVALAVNESTAELPGKVEDLFVASREWRQAHVAVTVVEGTLQSSKGHLLETPADASQSVLVKLFGFETSVTLDASAVEPCRAEEGDTVLIVPELDSDPVHIGILVNVSGDHPMGTVYFGAENPGTQTSPKLLEPGKEPRPSQLYMVPMTRVLALSPEIAVQALMEKTNRALDGPAQNCEIAMIIADETEEQQQQRRRRIVLFKRHPDRTTKAEATIDNVPLSLSTLVAWSERRQFVAYGPERSISLCNFATGSLEPIMECPDAWGDFVSLVPRGANELVVGHSPPQGRASIVHVLSLAFEGSSALLLPTLERVVDFKMDCLYVCRLSNDLVVTAANLPDTAATSKQAYPLLVRLCMDDESEAAPPASLADQEAASLSLLDLYALHANVKWAPLRFTARSGPRGPLHLLAKEEDQDFDVMAELMLSDGGSVVKLTSPSAHALVFPLGASPRMGRAVFTNQAGNEPVTVRVKLLDRLVVVLDSSVVVAPGHFVSLELRGVAAQAVEISIEGTQEWAVQARLLGCPDGDFRASLLYERLMSAATQAQIIRLMQSPSGAESRIALKLLLDRLECGAAFVADAATLTDLLRAFCVRDSGDASSCMALLKSVPQDVDIFGAALSIVREACDLASTRAGLSTLGQILVEYWPTAVTLANEAVRDRLMALLVELGQNITEDLYTSTLRVCFREFGCTVLHDALPEGNSTAHELLSLSLANQSKRKSESTTASPSPPPLSSIAAAAAAAAAGGVGSTPGSSSSAVGNVGAASSSSASGVSALRIHSATYNSSVASNSTGFEISFTDVLRNKDNAVVLDLGQIRLISSVEVTVMPQEPFPDACIPLVCVETWLSQPPVAGDRVLMLGRGIALELYAISGAFTFDKREGVIGVKSTFPTVAPRGVSIKSGAWYYEVTLVETTDGVAQIGWCDASFSGDDKSATGTGDDEHSWAFDGYRTKKWNGGPITWGKKWANGDVVGCAINLEEKSVYFSLNGSWKRPMGLAFSDINVDDGVFPAITGERAFKCTVNFGQAHFRHSPPSSSYRPIIDWVLEHHRLEREPISQSKRGEHVWIRAPLSRTSSALSASKTEPDEVEARFIRVTLLNRELLDLHQRSNYARSYASSLGLASTVSASLSGPGRDTPADQDEDVLSRRINRPRVPVKISVRTLMCRRLLPFNLDNLPAQQKQVKLEYAKGLRALEDARAHVTQAIDAFPIESIDPFRWTPPDLPWTQSDKTRPAVAQQTAVHVVEAVAEAQRVQSRAVEAVAERLLSIDDALCVQGTPPPAELSAPYALRDFRLSRTMAATQVLTSLCLAKPPLVASLATLQSVFMRSCVMAPESPAHQSMVLDLVKAGINTFDDGAASAMATFAVQVVVGLFQHPPFRLAGFYQRRLFDLLETLIARVPESAPLFERQMCDLLAEGDRLDLASMSLPLVHRVRALSAPGTASSPSPSLLRILLAALASGQADLALLLFDLVALPLDEQGMRQLVVASSRMSSPFVHDALATLVAARNDRVGPQIIAIALKALESEPECDAACLMSLVVSAVRRGAPFTPADTAVCLDFCRKHAPDESASMTRAWGMCLVVLCQAGALDSNEVDGVLVIGTVLESPHRVASLLADEALRLCTRVLCSASTCKKLLGLLTRLFRGGDPRNARLYYSLMAKTSAYLLSASEGEDAVEAKDTVDLLRGVSQAVGDLPGGAVDVLALSRACEAIVAACKRSDVRLTLFRALTEADRHSSPCEQLSRWLASVDAASTEFMYLAGLVSEILVQSDSSAVLNTCLDRLVDPSASQAQPILRVVQAMASRDESLAMVLVRRVTALCLHESRLPSRSIGSVRAIVGASSSSVAPSGAAAAAAAPSALNSVTGGGVGVVGDITHACELVACALDSPTPTSPSDEALSQAWRSALEKSTSHDDAAAASGETRPAEIVFQPGTSSVTFVLSLPAVCVLSRVELDFAEGHRKSMLPARVVVETGTSFETMLTSTSVAVSGTGTRVVRGERTVTPVSCRLDVSQSSRLLRITIALPSFQPQLDCFAFFKGAKVMRGPKWAHGDEDGGEGSIGVVVHTVAPDWVRVSWSGNRIDSYHAYELRPESTDHKPRMVAISRLSIVAAQPWDRDVFSASEAVLGDLLELVEMLLGRFPGASREVAALGLPLAAALMQCMCAFPHASHKLSNLVVTIAQSRSDLVPELMRRLVGWSNPVHSHAALLAELSTLPGADRFVLINHVVTLLRSGPLSLPVHVYFCRALSLLLEDEHTRGVVFPVPNDICELGVAMARQLVPGCPAELALVQLVSVAARHSRESRAVVERLLRGSTDRLFSLVASSHPDLVRALIFSGLDSLVDAAVQALGANWDSSRVIATLGDVVRASGKVRAKLGQSGALDRLLDALAMNAEQGAVFESAFDVVCAALNLDSFNQRLVAKRIIDEIARGNSAFALKLLKLTSGHADTVIVHVWSRRAALQRLFDSPAVGLAVGRDVRRQVHSLLHLNPNACGKTIELSNGGLTATQSVFEKWGMVRADREVPMSGTSSWEVRVDVSAKGHVFVGVATARASVDSFLGSDRHGWGYIGNRGAWHNKHKEKTFGKDFRTGDVIRLVLDQELGTLSYSLNGEDLGVAFVGLNGLRLYPAFALYQRGDRITVLSCSMSNDDASVTEAVVSHMDDQADTRIFTSGTVLVLGAHAKASEVLRYLGDASVAASAVDVNRLLENPKAQWVVSVRGVSGEIDPEETLKELVTRVEGDTLGGMLQVDLDV